MEDGNVNENGGMPAARPVTSVEKLQAMMLAASGQTPDSEDQAQALSAFRMIAPLVGRLLPEDPEELDRLLLNGAKWALALRSDGAEEPETVAELKEAASL